MQITGLGLKITFAFGLILVSSNINANEIDNDRLPGNVHYFINVERNKDINLTSWTLNNSPAPKPRVKYNRTSQFGPWLKIANDNFCLDTRAKVLIRDSKKPTTRHTDFPCTIDRGAWHDPYTNKVLTKAREQVQVDHVVPLKNSYLAGAYRWDWKTRCAFANFMGNNYHLIPVDGQENNSKSDKAPDEYMPANLNFQCTYMSIWLRIKATWGLALSEPEAKALKLFLKRNNCDKKMFIMSATEFMQQQVLIQQTKQLCPNSPNDIPRDYPFMR
jgi:hypothetical protein